MRFLTTTRTESTKSFHSVDIEGLEALMAVFGGIKAKMYKPTEVIITSGIGGVVMIDVETSIISPVEEKRGGACCFSVHHHSQEMADLMSPVKITGMQTYCTMLFGAPPKGYEIESLLSEFGITGESHYIYRDFWNEQAFVCIDKGTGEMTKARWGMMRSPSRDPISPV